jgi:hypothetical protein
VFGREGMDVKFGHKIIVSLHCSIFSHFNGSVFA